MTLQEWGKKAQKIRVPTGLLFAIVFIFVMRPTLRSMCAGGILALAGAALRIWAAGHIDKGKRLARGGPYAFTRNPLYLGSLIMATGILLAGRAYWLLLPFAILYVALYYPVMKAEERELRGGFGEEFDEFVRNVPLFFPRFHSAAAARSTFLWSRVIRNGEHRTVAGFLVVTMFLILRAM
jgi:protein-S-isoprenylcysteine O-methyltransferase Ste14